MYKITSYKYINNNAKNTVLYLHGWGCNLNYMLPLIDGVSNWNCLIIDLPGFGKNKGFDTPKNFEEIANIILTFIKENSFYINYIVGHSFGGKLAAFLSTKLSIKSIFLFAPSIYNKPRFLSYYIKIYFYKLLKKMLPNTKLLNRFGSKDYKSLDNVMKTTMSNVINYKMNPILKNIKCDVFLFFSKNDKITPTFLGKKIKKNIHSSQLYILNGNHFAYLSNIFFINKIIESVVLYGF